MPRKKTTTARTRASKKKTKKNQPKKVHPERSRRVTRYTHEHLKEPRTPETGHTPLLPADEQVVTLPMDNGWTKAIKVGQLPESNGTPHHRRHHSPPLQGQSAQCRRV